MKKIILIVIMFISCYFVYNLTIDNHLYYLSIGDFLSEGINNKDEFTKGYNDYIKEYLQSKNILSDYNNSFSSKEYRITDLIRILDYNETKKIDNKNISLNQLLKKADILTISVGTTEIYYKLFLNTNNIYDYIEDMLMDIDILFDKINRFSYDKVFVLGYYNITKNNKDIFNYANYELNKISKKYNFIYIDLSNNLDYNPNYFENTTNFYPNNAGYKKISQIIVEKLEKN